MASAPILYTLPSHEYMVEGLTAIPDLVAGTWALARFPNDELYLALDAKAPGHRCIVLGSIAPPETTLVSFLLLCHTLQEEGATAVTAVLPYLAYSRHDKKEPQKSHATALIGELLSSAGVDEVVTVDVHSPQAERLFPIPLVSLSPAPIFANEIAKFSLPGVTIVAPDEGAIDRCEAVARAAGLNREIAYLTKHRTATGVTHRELHGTVGAQVVIVDDMLDTGGTLISCCEKLLAEGVQEIYIMVTHGLFTGTAWEQVWDLGVKQIYCTDSLPLPERMRSGQITVLSIIPLLVHELTKNR
jgi:ribose-phosphate pyrophosphokinase